MTDRDRIILDARLICLTDPEAQASSILIDITPHTSRLVGDFRDPERVFHLLEILHPDSLGQKKGHPRKHLWASINLAEASSHERISAKNDLVKRLKGIGYCENVA